MKSTRSRAMPGSGDFFAVERVDFGRANQSPIIFLGSREYDRRTFRCGELDKLMGVPMHENPFLMPDNRDAWAKGWERS